MAATHPPAHTSLGGAGWTIRVPGARAPPAPPRPCPGLELDLDQEPEEVGQDAARTTQPVHLWTRLLPPPCAPGTPRPRPPPAAPPACNRVPLSPEPEVTSARSRPDSDPPQTAERAQETRPRGCGSRRQDSWKRLRRPLRTGKRMVRMIPA